MAGYDNAAPMPSSGGSTETATAGNWTQHLSSYLDQVDAWVKKLRSTVQGGAQQRGIAHEAIGAVNQASPFLAFAMQNGFMPGGGPPPMGPPPMGPMPGMGMPPMGPPPGMGMGGPPPMGPPPGMGMPPGMGLGGPPPGMMGPPPGMGMPPGLGGMPPGMF